MRAAVVVNDMASVNVDAGLVSDAERHNLPSSSDTTTDPSEVVELTNGCICCTLRDDLARQLVELATRRDTRTKKKQFDYIFVESTGISEPLPVAQVFLMPITMSPPQSAAALRGQNTHVHSESENHSQPKIDNTGGQVRELNDVAYIDALVSVVDAKNFWYDFTSEDRLPDRGLELGPKDNRTVVDLITAQVQTDLSCDRSSYGPLCSTLVVHLCRSNMPML